MTYTRTMILTVPVALIDTANKLAKAFDPDNSGEHTFQLPTSEDSSVVQTTVSSSTPITEQLFEAAPYMLADAEALHASTLLDYQTRWPDLVPPTLEEVAAFCAAVQVELI